MDTKELKPCPFCGGLVELERAENTRGGIYGERKWWGVVCRNTINRGGTCAIQQAPSASEDAAIDRWNMRTPAAAAGAPDLRRAIPTWQEQAAAQYPALGVADLHYHTRLKLADAEIADLRAALASAAPVEALTCAWTPDADYEAEAWHSSCGEAWSFIDGGPKENCVRFCQGCGKPVAIQARAIEARIKGQPAGSAS